MKYSLVIVIIAMMIVIILGCLYFNNKNVEFFTINNNIDMNNKIDTSNLAKYSSLNLYNNHLLKNIGITLMKKDNCLSPCNPTFVFNEDGNLIVIVRFVNYMYCKINKNRPLKTLNVIATIDVNNELWKKMNEKELVSNNEYVHVGVEDFRMLNYHNTIYYTANVPLYTLHRKIINVELGCIDGNNNIYNNGMIKIKQNTPWSNKNGREKNWVLFIDGFNNLKIVYKWNPLIICNCYTNTNPNNNKHYKYILKKTDEIETIEHFKSLRGTTNGVNIGNEIWFICHICHNQSYYHCVVVLNATTYKPMKYSSFFKFNNVKVEFCIGCVYLKENNSFLIGYGIEDKKTNYVIIKKSVFDDIMIPIVDNLFASLIPFL